MFAIICIGMLWALFVYVIIEAMQEDRDMKDYALRVFMGRDKLSSSPMRRFYLTVFTVKTWGLYFAHSIRKGRLFITVQVGPVVLYLDRY